MARYQYRASGSGWVGFAQVGEPRIIPLARYQYRAFGSDWVGFAQVGEPRIPLARYQYRACGSGRVGFIRVGDPRMHSARYPYRAMGAVGSILPNGGLFFFCDGTSSVVTSAFSPNYCRSPNFVLVDRDRD